MDALLLEGWLPIILVGIAFAVIIPVLTKTINRKTMYIISSLLGLVCCMTILYSIFAVGGWDGMAIGFYSISAFFGIAVGTAISPFIKKPTHTTRHNY